MTEIPEDVMKAVTSAIEKHRAADGSALKCDYAMIEYIARAILAERERAEAEAARLRDLLADAGKALEPFASGANRMDISASIRKYGIRADYPELSAARTVATKIEEALK